MRYAAFLRGVSPSNAKMPELARAFEAAGFGEVRTVLSSGNVLFSARAAGEEALARRAEEAMEARLGKRFATIVRPVEALRALLTSDPWAAHRLPPGAKRVVTFLRRKPPAGLRLPVEEDGARLLAVDGLTAFGAYLPSPRGPVFMVLIERTFGKDVTTRTWDTVGKVAR
ncbi:MAG: DUF1697 domain-containing protein [Deltaproteobacteria bacterium]|nr:DUF1697 domain-containing protein [Deltaproteobacteria bacterium]